MRDGAEAGLRVVEELLDRGDLSGYHRAHAARGELCLRAGRHSDAAEAFAKAVELTKQGPERRFLEQRLQQARSIAPVQ
jgi:RNA polymerase sigma-70 factor (ECF subfamily)